MSSAGRSLPAVKGLDWAYLGLCTHIHPTCAIVVLRPSNHRFTRSLFHCCDHIKAQYSEQRVRDTTLWRSYISGASSYSGFIGPSPNTLITQPLTRTASRLYLSHLYPFTLFRILMATHPQPIMSSSTHFPRVRIKELIRFGTAAATAEHTARMSRSSEWAMRQTSGGKKSAKGKGKARAQETSSNTVAPRIIGCQDTRWGGENVSPFVSLVW